MQCRNDFCIYYHKASCTREDITLDTDGRCEQCIYVDIDSDVLEKARAATKKNQERIRRIY